jgi:glycosyltransferase involved in cell wall biosynthesis
MSQSYKIAIIAGQLVVGGAERQLYLWLSHLNREKFQPVVLTLHPGHGDYWEKPIEALGIPLHRIPHRRNKICRLIQIIKVLRHYKPHLIHGWHLFASVYAGLAAKVLRTKSIGGVRNTYQTFNSHSLEAKLTLWTVDALVANSNATAGLLEQKIRPGKQRVFAVQNAIEDLFIEREAIRKRFIQDYDLPKDAFWIGSLGRLDPLKRFDWLIQVVSKLRDEGCNIHFILIGDGPERQRLERLAKDLELSEIITFTGEVPQASTWLKALDIFAFSSMDEGMPNVIMEAAAAGLPIVTWRLPFYEELLEDGETALLLEPENITALANGIVKLIELPDLRSALGQAAQSHILAFFSLEAYIKKMTDVYESVLAKFPDSFREKS